MIPLARTFSTPSKVIAGRSDTFRIYDSQSDFARDYRDGNIKRGLKHSGHWGNVQSAIYKVTNGDATRVAESEKFLSEVENLVQMPSARHVIIDDVSGAVPNVPAFLAGQPLTMRRKARRTHEAAPIAIVADGTTSGGISNADMAKRGAVILALARALSAVRPVELWMVSGLNGGKRSIDASWNFVRIETAPMDLARASYMVSDPLATRILGYGACYEAGNCSGAWPYHKAGPLNAKQLETVIRSALPHIGEVVAIPGMLLTDPMVRNPVKWLAERIGEFSGDDALAA